MVRERAVLLIAFVRLLAVTSRTSAGDSPPNILTTNNLEEVLIDSDSTETPPPDTGEDYDVSDQDHPTDDKQSEDGLSWTDGGQLHEPTDQENSKILLRVARAKNNFLRLGRAGSNNFLRFGKAGNNNFLRFGKADRNNFLRFGKPDRNFLRFGRTKSNFIRFGRGKPNNFLRFGRDFEEVEPEIEESVDSPPISDEESATNDDFVRVRRGGSSSNFIRFGRDGDNHNVIRLGKADNFLRFGRKDNFMRFGRDEEKRSGKSLHFGRGKLADRNFIRLGRSSEQTVDYIRPVNNRRDGSGRRDNFIRLGNGKRDMDRAKDNFIRLGGKRGNGLRKDNFIRFGGKRTEENADDGIIRLSRDVKSTDNIDTLEDHEETNSSQFELSRSKRSLVTEEVAGLPPTNDNADVDNVEEQKASPMLFDNLQGPLRYYSPLAVGLPNYILAPEFSFLPPINKEVLAKRAKSSGSGSNFIRLG